MYILNEEGNNHNAGNGDNCNETSSENNLWLDLGGCTKVWISQCPIHIVGANKGSTGRGLATCDCIRRLYENEYIEYLNMIYPVNLKVYSEDN